MGFFTVFMQHEDHPDHAWGVSGKVEAIPTLFEAKIQGDSLGTFPTTACRTPQKCERRPEGRRRRTTTRIGG